MKLPRDISGLALARLLERYGYHRTRQTGSHLRLSSTYAGQEHHVTIPLHDSSKVGTLNAILAEVREYQGVERARLVESLFVD